MHSIHSSNIGDFQITLLTSVGCKNLQKEMSISYKNNNHYISYQTGSRCRGSWEGLESAKAPPVPHFLGTAGQSSLFPWKHGVRGVTEEMINPLKAADETLESAHWPGCSILGRWGGDVCASGSMYCIAVVSFSQRYQVYVTLFIQNVENKNPKHVQAGIKNTPT